jgi:hypothetical protein
MFRGAILPTTYRGVNYVAFSTFYRLNPQWLPKAPVPPFKISLIIGPKINLIIGPKIGPKIGPTIVPKIDPK